MALRLRRQQKQWNHLTTLRTMPFDSYILGQVEPSPVNIVISIKIYDMVRFKLKRN
jgi:hypothetical protein